MPYIVLEWIVIFNLVLSLALIIGFLVVRKEEEEIVQMLGEQASNIHEMSKHLVHHIHPSILDYYGLPDDSDPICTDLEKIEQLKKIYELEENK